MIMKIKEEVNLGPLADCIMISYDHCSAFRIFSTIGTALSSQSKPSEQFQATPHDFNTAIAAQQTAEGTSQPPTFFSYNPQITPDYL